MKLLIEQVHDVQYVTEAASDGKKNVFIEGVFMQAEKANRNNRMYRRDILEGEVNRFQTMINEKRALGELGHPPTPAINLDKVSHLITTLRFEGNDAIGRAKVLDTPNGKIAKNLLDEGVRLGVSSRGMGSLGEARRDGIQEVQKDFHLATIDMVADPSAHDAFVNGIYESAEWLYVEGRGYMMDDLRKNVDAVIKETKYDRVLREQKTLKYIQRFLESIK